MSLIFDFGRTAGTVAAATRVADAVRAEFGVEAQVFNSAVEAQEADPIPSELHAPVLHVDRAYDVPSKENHIIAYVRQRGGHFVGT